LLQPAKNVLQQPVNGTPVFLLIAGRARARLLDRARQGAHHHVLPMFF
jgi:hypothetical protein